MVVKLFICFVLIFVLTTNGTCPEGTVEWQNSCYFFQSNLTSFPNAEFTCTKMNGNLASIHDGFTNALLAGQAQNLFHESTVVDFWIGLNALVSPGNFSWTDKTNVDFMDWAPSDNKNQTCVAVTIQNGYWISDDCYKTKPFVCEVSPLTSDPAYVNCSHGWIYFESTNSLLYDETGDPFWTGLYSNDNELTWNWSDESPLDYLPWASTNPNRKVSSCASLKDEHIYDYNCSNQFYTICKKAGPTIYTTCPLGSVQWHNYCYFFRFNSTSFSNAEISCQNLKGHLASIHDGFSDAILTAQSSLYFNETTIDFWIGLNTLMTPGKWSWMDNTKFDFKNWGSSEPKNLSMNCASVTIHNGYWISDDCFKAKPYVCEVPSIAATPNSTYVNCSYGWFYFEPTNCCYGKNDIGYWADTWTDAEEYCLKQNAHLVSLHSFEETKFLSTTWKWSDRSSLDYLPWARGYPSQNVSSCAYLMDEYLYDYNCNAGRYAVCKKSAPTF
uniref:C-type lectin domain-containing protein n=1 Tax=Panagrolaimus davidi TaxID=227884 RepID=A0A914QIJ7_9BILA